MIFTEIGVVNTKKNVVVMIEGIEELTVIKKIIGYCIRYYGLLIMTYRQ